MFRYSFAIYLLLINLTGPAPCCCTMARFFEMVTGGILPASCNRPVALPCCSGTLTVRATASTAPTDEPNRSTDRGCPERTCHCESLVSVEAAAPVTIMADQARAWLTDLASVMGVIARFDASADSDCRDQQSTDCPRAVPSGRETRVAIGSLIC